jgi:hypothetical protein
VALEPELTASALQGYHERVDESVPDENRKTCYELQASGHPAGIDEGGYIVLDKPTFVAGLPCEASNPVL